MADQPSNVGNAAGNDVDGLFSSMETKISRLLHLCKQQQGGGSCASPGVDTTTTGTTNLAPASSPPARPYLHADAAQEVSRLQRENAKLRAQIQALWQQQRYQQQEQQHKGADDSQGEERSDDDEENDNGSDNAEEVGAMRRRIDELNAIIAKKDDGLRQLAHRNQQLQRLVDASDIVDLANPFA